jgi:hypothetical protein
MAKLSGPCFSLDASGKLGDTVVFSKWKGRNYARQWLIPANPKSPGQTGIRAMFSMLSQAWYALSSLIKATWDELAAAGNYSAFNAYMRENMLRWRTFTPPTQSYPAAEAHSGTTVATLVTTGGESKVDVSGTLTSGTNQWAVIIFRDDAEITTPMWDNVVAVLPVDGGTTFQWVDSPLDPGTYHYRAASITDDGVIGTVKADQTAVVS